MKTLATVFIGLLAMAGTVQGQILTFEFSALAGNEATAASNFNNANLGSSTISRGAGLTAGSNGGRFNATSFTTSATLDATDYFEFTITPNSGYQYSITSIVIQYQRSGTGPVKFSLRSSADSYASDLGGEQLGTDVPTTQTFTFTFTQTDITTATTYRFYNYGAESGTGTGGPGDGTGDDIVVNGSVTEIPSAGPANPVSFTATSASSSQINLAFTQNAATDDVVIAFNTVNTFGEPTGTYTASDPITGGGTVLYVGATSPFNHTGLTGNTQYFYKAWSVNGTSYSAGLTANATTLKVEPTAHATAFEEDSKTISNIVLTWTDAASGQAPDGYLIRSSTTSFAAIESPVDGTAISNNASNINVNQSVQTVNFTGLDDNTTYYFKIFPYTNSGVNIDYKTDGSVPEVEVTTNEALEFVETFETVNYNLTASYLGGSFVGVTGVTWTYVASRNEDIYPINGDNGIMLRRVSDNSSLTSSTISGGISEFSVLVRKGFTGAGNRQVELLIGPDINNLESFGTSVAFDINDEIRSFTVSNINYVGDFVMRIANTQTGQIVIDDVSWSSYEGGEISLSTTPGWRMMSSPVSTTYGTLLAPGWTQGITGSDSPTNGTANVFTFTSGAFAAVTNMSNSIPAGSGFIYYHFGDDNYDNVPNASATTFGVTGSENGAVTDFALATGSVASTEGWTLMGNPFASTINWSGRQTTGTVNGSVYVYTTGTGDTNDGNGNPRYESWNGSAGNLSSGRIAPFQGFFVKADAASSTVSIPTSAKSTTAGTFRGKESVAPSFVVRLSDGNRTNDAWFSFTENGEVGKDAADAYKLDPLDGTFISVFSTIDGVPMDIQNLPAQLNERLEIPISVKSMNAYSGVDGDFSLSLANLTGIQDSWDITLLDHETGTEVDLRDASHSFRWTAPREKMRPVTERVNNPVMTTAAATAPRFTLIIDPSKTTSVDGGPETVGRMELEQNYPNPFNPSTQIRFTLDAGHQTRLTVYDVLGREVAVLVDGTMPAGAHSVTFDASNLTSGVYLYKLEAGGMTMTKRMTLVK